MSTTEESPPSATLNAEQLSLALEAVGDGVFDWRIADHVWIRSESWYQLTGFTRDELTAWEAEHGTIVHPDDVDVINVALQRHIRRETDRYHCEFRIRHKSGAWRWLLGRGLILQRGPKGEPLRLVGTDTDITARKWAEDALRASEHRFRNAVIHAPFPIMIHAEDGEVLQINQIWTDLTGYAQDDIPTIEEWTRVAYGKRTHAVRDRIDKLYAINGRVSEGEYAPRMRDGQTRIWEFNSSPLGRLPDGRRLVLSIAVDVTERKRAEEALQRAHDELEQRVRARTAELQEKNRRLQAEIADRAQAQRELQHSESRLADAQRIAHIGNWDWNIVTNELHWSDEIYRIFGLSPGESGATHEGFLGRVHPDDREFVSGFVDRALHEGKPYSVDHRIILPDGDIRTVHEQGEVSFDESDAAVRMFGTMQDITERRKAEDRQRLTQFAVDHSTDPIYWVREDGGIGYVNDAACQTLGHTREELTSMLVSQIDPDFPASDWPAHWRKMKEAGSMSFESRHRTNAGRVFPVEIRTDFVMFGEREYIWAYVRDVTERERMESQLRQSQKMEAIGLLAGGVAHDFNNILTVILAHCELMRDALNAPAPNIDSLQSDVDQIERSSDRAAALTRQLLAFSRRQTVAPRILDPHQMLGEMEEMLARLMRADIDFQVIRGSNVATIFADAAQIEQVVMNLVVNAADAMPQGGRITLETANATLDDEYAARHAAARAGPHVMIAVSDTGCGMNQETLRRIFEPFFTTKPVGEGTGLGLATVHGIVKRFDGHVTVESEPDQGSSFKVYFPARTEPAADVAGRSRPPASQTGTETVLVCEDDAKLRDLACRVLRKRGYEVLPAEDAAAALKLADDHNGPIHLLLTDVIMPGLNGRQLAETLCKQRDDLRVLYMSGYTANVIAQHGILDQTVELLEKPFGSTDLLSYVRRVLDK